MRAEDTSICASRNAKQPDATWEKMLNLITQCGQDFAFASHKEIKITHTERSVAEISLHHDLPNHPCSDIPPSGRPPARGARAEAPNCRAPEMDSSTPTRRKWLSRAAASSPGPHLDLGRGNRVGSAAVGARACSPGLSPPSDRFAISVTRNEPKFSNVVQTATAVRQEDKRAPGYLWRALVFLSYPGARFPCPSASALPRSAYEFVL